MSRMSRGCLPCRTRKVKCDEGKPSCRRCVQRGDLCTGYRDETTLVFRHENEKVSRKFLRRRTSDLSSTSSKISSTNWNSSGSFLSYTASNDPFDFSAVEISDLSLYDPNPLVKDPKQAPTPAVEDQAVSEFFEKFVMYPCNIGSSPGFLEHLPSMFQEVSVENRVCLRWAVLAAAYAGHSKDKNSVHLNEKAVECYGRALSALSKSLADPKVAPDDYILMTIVVLDLFETMYLGESKPIGPHAEGMKQILRLRGNHQMYGARGWSLFRLSHHRVQKQQLAFKQEPMLESKAWLDSLNDEMPEVQIEKQNFEIAKVCERAGNLLDSITDPKLEVGQVVSMVKEMHNLDRMAITWRKGPNWSFKTIHRSEMLLDAEAIPHFPQFIQLHRDTWIAYEWNYHRTARIILHGQLLQCLDQLLSTTQEAFQSDLKLLKQASIGIIQNLIDEILSTVPQSLGDIDQEGNLQVPSEASKCRGVGAYFLLWPIKITKTNKSATAEQRESAQYIFERIRDYTGMKDTLGELSCI